MEKVIELIATYKLYTAKKRTGIYVKHRKSMCVKDSCIPALQCIHKNVKVTKGDTLQ
jgi:hypothetical protein